MNVTCISALRSMTHAQKAVRILKERGVSAAVVSLDSKTSTHGCAYGVSYPCVYRTRAVQVLEESGLGYGETLTR